MARDWFKRNRNQGNILKCGGRSITSNATVKPKANVTVVNVDMAAATTITGDASESIVGDLLLVPVQNNTGGSLDLVFTGDFAAGTVSVGAGGVASVVLLFNGVNFAATVTPA